MDGYPCKDCNHVKHPDQCDNKKCEKWRAWFLRKWEELRTLWKT
jgi:hypothetical protein